MANKRTSVSIYTVADAAGVSYATVSRVFNNRSDVSARTRERVLAAAERLGYAPNPIARALTKKVTPAIGIIVPGIADPFFMPIAQSIEASARTAGYTTLLHDTGRLVENALDGARALAQFQVSGVIILGGSDSKDAEMAEWLEGVPTVVALRRSHADLFPSVSLDHAEGARALAAHLLTTGRTRIAFVGGDDDSVASLERRRGYQDALAQAGMEQQPALIERGLFTIEGGGQATARLLQLPVSQQPDAIIYASDAMALGGLHCLHNAGIVIPRQMAVAGYGNIPFAAISYPPLTTVKVSKREIGRIAFEQLRCRFEQRDSTIENVQVPVELIIRESTAPQTE